MSLKVLLVVLNIIIFVTSTGVSENEFLPVSTSESLEAKNINKNSATISKIKQKTRHFLAGMTQMLQADKPTKKKQHNVDYNTKKQFAQLQNRLQLLEKSNEEQQLSISRLEQSLEAKSQIVDEIQKKLDQQEKTIEEHQKSLPIVIEHSLKEKAQKISEMQKKLDQQEKMIEEQQKRLSRIGPNEKIVELEADHKEIEQKLLPRNCKEIQKNGNHSSGVYLIRPKSESFSVWCDMDTNGGGWSVIQNRFDGSEDFCRNWTDYRQGFGNQRGEFWLGLHHIHELTGTDSNKLLIILMDKNDTEVFAYYDNFTIGSEEESYPIKTLGTYNGTAGDSLRYHLGRSFSTWDRSSYRYNSARTYEGGWWFDICLNSNLNGKYSDDGTVVSRAQGINWYHFSTDHYSLLKSKMMVRS